MSTRCKTANHVLAAYANKCKSSFFHPLELQNAVSPELVFQFVCHPVSVHHLNMSPKPCCAVLPYYK